MQKHTLSLIRGDDVSLLIKFQTQDGELLNLNGARFDLHAKVDDDIVLTLSTEDNSIYFVENGIVLEFSHQKTANADWTIAEYDLQLLAKGKRRTLLGGKIRLTRDITEV